MGLKIKSSLLLWMCLLWCQAQQCPLGRALIFKRDLFNPCPTQLPCFLGDFSIPLRSSIQILTILTFRRYRKVHHEMAPDSNQDRWQAKSGWAKIHLQSVDNTRDRGNIYKNIIIFRCQIWLAWLTDYIKWYSKAQCTSSDESSIQRIDLVLRSIQAELALNTSFSDPHQKRD